MSQLKLIFKEMGLKSRALQLFQKMNFTAPIWLSFPEKHWQIFMKDLGPGFLSKTFAPFYKPPER